MHVMGSLGDVQPFIALAKGLQQHNHRVRIATHPTFRLLIQSHGIEFFSIGGDPSELMAYMVKNPGLFPKLETIRQGEVHRQRQAMKTIMQACWRSCFEPTDGVIDRNTHVVLKPFVADAIIANPPSFAHVHCAETLGIPLHIVFTMPWTPTRDFPHPLASLNAFEEDATMANFLSFFLIEAMIWQGLGDIVNRFRYKTLGLEQIDPTQATGLVERLHIPHTYCW
jgi:Glycosyltransferase family 28 N-terminal domain